MPNNIKQHQRQEQKANNVQAVTVMASELLTMAPEDIENRVKNEGEANPALEKGDLNEDDGNDSSPNDAPKSKYEPSRYGVSAEQQEAYERKASNNESLIEHMEEQLNASDFDERQRLIADYIVGSLDRNGYFRDDPYALADDITFKEGIYVEEDEVLQVLKQIQRMDPVGVGARDLKECLLLQLAQRHTPYTAKARDIVDKCFDDMTKNRLDRIATTLGITVDEVNEVYKKEIRKLDPKPAGAYDTSDTDFMVQVTPTFIINVDDDNVSYEIPNRIPELYVSKSYEEALDEYDHKDKLSNSDKEARKSIKDNVDKADIFVSALKMRAETLKQTIEAIIHIQHDFFVNNGDPNTLKPMKLKDLERITGRNASVLSRATSGKYMSTPWGLMPVRELFSERGKQVNAQGEAEDVSTRTIKMRLAQIIEKEDKSHPMSDDSLCNILKGEGYTISRRTVTKYREAMDIPKAALRRKF